jgi:magnesium-transporting ATPase (P-type)
LLTGDKQETAVKVGKSSRLISADMNIMTLNVKSAPECSVALDNCLEEIKTLNQAGIIAGIIV